MRLKLDPFSPNGVSVDTPVIPARAQSNGYVAKIQYLDELQDVDTSTTPPTNNQLLSYNATSGKWLPRTVSGGGGGGVSVWGDLTGDITDQTDLINYIDDSGLYFEVMHFGAVGDGSTDDSAAFQAAIDAAIAAGGGTVFFPAKTFLIGTTLTIDGDNLTLMGDGWGSVLKTAIGADMYLITVEDSALRKNLSFRDFKIDGDRLDQTSGGGISGSLAMSSIDRVWFLGCHDVGINLTGDTSPAFGYTNTITRCLFDGNGETGISFANNDENYVTGNTFNGQTVAAIYDNAGTQHILSNTFVGGGGSTGVGVYVDSTANTIIDDNVFDGPHEEAIKITADKCTIGTNRISKVAGGDTSKAAILIDGDRNTLYANNVDGGAFYTYALDASGATNTQLGLNYFVTGTSGVQTVSASTNAIYYSSGKVGIKTLTPSEEITVNGNLELRDGDTPTKAYRLRTSSAALDFDMGGADIYFASYPNADYSGTKNYFLGFSHSGPYADAFGNWYFHTEPFAPIKVTIDPGNSAPLQVDGNISVTGTVDGRDLSTDGTKLDGIASGATAYTNTNADARIAAAAGVSIASLVGGLVPTSQIPAVALTTVQTAASQAAQLALTTQEGDIVIRSDQHKSYMRNAGTSGTMTDFTLLDTPTDAVTSVNSQTGTVVLAKGDIGLGNVDNTSDATKNSATAALTNKDLTSGTNTFPTFNQNTTGTAAVATAANGLKSATTTVSVSAATAPTSGQVLTATGSTAATWQTPSGGTGSMNYGLTTAVASGIINF